MTTSPSLETYIEAILFYMGEPISVSELAAILERSDGEVQEALVSLSRALLERGVRLVRVDEHVELRSAGEAASIIEKLEQEELSRELSRASFETLAIMLYQGPVTRSEIEYIRGVQSQSSIRALYMRGLIEKIVEHSGKRGTWYRGTTKALAHLGVSSVEELPDYQHTRDQIAAGRSNEEEKEVGSMSTMKSS